MSLKQATTLDEWMKYSEMANPEIRVVWLSMVLEKGYQPAYFSASEFLQSTGRRKFLMPIYKALIVTEQGKIIAKNTYQKARSGYHFVAIESIDKLLLW